MTSEQTLLIEKTRKYVEIFNNLLPLYDTIASKVIHISDIWDEDKKKVTFSSLLTNFQYFEQHPTTYNESRMKFVLESYLFCLNNPDSWEIISYFAGSGFQFLNYDIELLSKKIKDPKLLIETQSKKWYEIMTSSDLPIIPEDLVLKRCNYTFVGKDTFDIVNKDYFDSYRTASTTLFDIGYCSNGTGIGNKGKLVGSMFAFMKCQKIKGLYINFNFGNDEQEVVIPPGIRYVWNKNEEEVKKRIPVEYHKKYENGQFIAQDQWDDTMMEYYRCYDLSFIPNPDEDKFISEDIALRFQNMQLGIKKINQIFAKHKEDRTKVRISEYLLKSKQRAQQRISEKALKNLESKIEEEKKMLEEKQAKKALKILPVLVKNALEEEKAEKSTVTQIAKKFLKVEKTFQKIDQNEKISQRLIELHEILGQFELSRYAKKFAVGLTQRCTLIRQSNKSDKWRYIDKKNVPALIQEKLNKEKNKKCAK